MFYALLCTDESVSVQGEKRPCAPTPLIFNDNVRHSGCSHRRIGLIFHSFYPGSCSGSQTPQLRLKSLQPQMFPYLYLLFSEFLFYQSSSVGVQGGKRSMKSKSKPLCCYFHSAYVSVRVVQVPKRGLDLSLLDSPTSTADNSDDFQGRRLKRTGRTLIEDNA